MKSDDFFLGTCMRDRPNEGILSMCTSSVQKCGLEKLENLHTFLKDFFLNICSTGGPTEDILPISLCHFGLKMKSPCVRDYAMRR